MKLKKRLSIILCIAVLAISLIGCTDSTTDTVSNGETTSVETQGVGVEVADTSTIEIDDEMFSSRDMESGYDENNSTIIVLEEDTIKINNESATVKENTVTISQEGTYILRGTLSDGQIVVDAADTDKIQIVLDNVEINNSFSAPIYVKQADKVFITLANSSKNSISVDGEFISIDDNNIDAAIFSKEDLTINGSGSLTITNKYGNGITSKDDLVLTNGIYDINVNGHGLEGKNSIRISNGEFNIVSGKDGIHSENSDDDTLGFVYIQNGEFNLIAADDGISSESKVQIDSGNIIIKESTEGIKGNYVLINDGSIDIYSTDDGINATNLGSNDAVIEINGGDITIVMASGDTDAIDSNGDIYVNGGNFDLTCGSSFDADGEIIYNSGTVVVNGETIEDITLLQMNGKGHK
ncbi:MAG: carbohydrate-binding domain-containing protein [Gudongella sp.]|nr:carbohydrate-binding domain-containing protein [Gudongella sp.]